MKELGESFSFIGSEYKFKIGNAYNYIDLLLFNYEYNCFVVIELKYGLKFTGTATRIGSFEGIPLRHSLYTLQI